MRCVLLPPPPPPLVDGRGVDEGVWGMDRSVLGAAVGRDGMGGSGAPVGRSSGILSSADSAFCEGI